MSMTAEDRDAVRDTDLDDAELHARLSRTWGTAQGVIGALSTVDHKIIGIRYTVTAFAFLLLGGLAAMIMRVQLAQPNNDVVSAEVYNQLFTMHGTRNIAFPRLNAFSYYVYLFGGLMLWGGFLLGIRPDVGWFSYVPLASLQYTPDKGPDYWAQMITFTEVA